MVLLEGLDTVGAEIDLLSVDLHVPAAAGLAVERLRKVRHCEPPRKKDLERSRRLADADQRGQFSDKFL